MDYMQPRRGVVYATIANVIGLFFILAVVALTLGGVIAVGHILDRAITGQVCVK